jgi:hypothetical protein
MKIWIDQFVWIKKTIQTIVSSRGAVVSLTSERDKKGNIVKVIVQIHMNEDELTALSTMFQKRWNKNLDITFKDGNINLKVI